MSKKTILSVWDHDEGRASIVSRELSDYNLKHPESLLIIETIVSVDGDPLVIKPVGVDYFDSMVDADEYTELTDYDYIYFAIVHGLLFMSLHLSDLFNKLACNFGEGIVNDCKVKPYEFPKTEAEGN